MVASFLFLCHIKKAAPSSADPTSIQLLHEGKNRTFPSPVFFSFFPRISNATISVSVFTLKHKTIRWCIKLEKKIETYADGQRALLLVRVHLTKISSFFFFFLRLFLISPLVEKKMNIFFSSGLVIVLVVGIYIRNPV